VREELAQSCGEVSPRRQARPEAGKCRDGAPRGECTDRKVHERLRTVFRRIDRKIRHGCLANTPRLPALHSPCWGIEKGTGAPSAGKIIRAPPLGCLKLETDARRASGILASPLPPRPFGARHPLPAGGERGKEGSAKLWLPDFNLIATWNAPARS
jgi:hypothetical protein